MIEELADQLLLAGGGVAGERNAGAGVIAQVAEDHQLNVDRGAPGVGDVVHAAIDIGAGVVPGAEHGLDGAHELLLGIGGEVLADLLFILGLEHGRPASSGPQRVKLDVVLDALLLPSSRR